MIPIKKGKLTLEKGQEVDIKDFRIGQYELTYAEYDVFVFANKDKKGLSVKASEETNTQNECFELPDDQGWGRGSRPVINVSWDCAQQYLQWLNEHLKPDKPYRLPSETQWEYAIRACTISDYYWEGKGRAQEFAWFNENSRDKTHPVGNRLPNDFKLYDMAGNVWEWVEDCDHDDYQNAPPDGSPWQEQNKGDCSRRVLRGGALSFSRGSLRSATRDRGNPGDRLNDIGFRLAQD